MEALRAQGGRTTFFICSQSGDRREDLRQRVDLNLKERYLLNHLDRDRIIQSLNMNLV